MKKCIIALLVLMMICGCSEKEKSLADQVMDFIKDSDREGCLLLMDAALKEASDNPELYVLKARCYSAPDIENGISPVVCRDSAFALLNEALYLDPENPELKEKIDEAWLMVNETINVFETTEKLPDKSFDEVKKEEDDFKVTAENFWVNKEPPIDHTTPYFENNDGNISIGGDREMYFFTYFHDEEHRRPYWSTRMYWQGNHDYVNVFYYYSVYNHDYYPCIRKDIVISDMKKYFDYAPHAIEGEPEMVQANSINIYEYDKDGNIVKSYAYVYDGGLTLQDHIVDYSPFNQ